MNNGHVKQESRSENRGPNTGCWVQGRGVADRTRHSVNIFTVIMVPQARVKQTVVRGVFDK